MVTLLVAGWWIVQPGTRARMLRALRRIPAMGERVRVYQLTRFYRTLGMLLTGGIADRPGARHGRRACSTPTCAAASTPRPRAWCAKGRPAVGWRWRRAGLTTPVALRLLRVGERTGQMGEMMERIATFHDEEMARWVDWFTKTFEPLLMALIGVVIGGIVVLMYLPIFELAGSVR